MSRVNTARTTPAERTELRRELIHAIQALQQEDVSHFLADLLTPGEILMLGRRIRIARALLAGTTYEVIAHEEKASYSTIQLVDHAIARGLEGYRHVLPRVTKTQKTADRRRGTLPNETIETLRRLPGMGMYRFWLDLFDDGEEK